MINKVKLRGHKASTGWYYHDYDFKLSNQVRGNGNDNVKDLLGIPSWVWRNIFSHGNCYIGNDDNYLIDRLNDFLNNKLEAVVSTKGFVLWFRGSKEELQELYNAYLVALEDKRKRIEGEWS